MARHGGSDKPSRKRDDREDDQAAQADPEVPAWPAPESALRSVRPPRSLEELRTSLKERDPAKPPDDKSFPAEAEVEYERSVIRIPFYLKRPVSGGRRRTLDIMNFDAYMRIIREEPIRSGLGVRQFEFYIDAWELTNTYSSGLNANVTFTLSDTVQPKSLCVALQRDRDYPALITYNAIYDIYLGSERIVERQPGTAFATPVWSTPPRNVTVAFEKPFESDLFSFCPGDCEGMRSISKTEFERGANEARQIRTGNPPAAEA